MACDIIVRCSEPCHTSSLRCHPDIEPLLSLTTFDSPKPHPTTTHDTRQTQPELQTDTAQRMHAYVYALTSTHLVPSKPDRWRGAPDASRLPQWAALPSSILIPACLVHLPARGSSPAGTSNKRQRKPFAFWFQILPPRLFDFRPSKVCWKEAWSTSQATLKALENPRDRIRQR